ncbi:MAG: phosphoglucosamine mutase, partial [Actinomycetota bacterium]
LLMEDLRRTSRSLAEAASVMVQWPQVMVNVRTTERLANPAADLEHEITACEERLGEDGRILVRSSGTEPLVRVMVEASDDAIALGIAGDLAGALVARFGGSIEGTH